MIKAYPKIFTIGQTHIQDIFHNDVVVEEKIDGSQMAFGKINGELFIRTKGARLYPDNPEKMFKEGIEYISSIADAIPSNIIFYGEYLQRAKHNTLMYRRIPTNHIMIFGASNAMGDVYVDYYSDIVSGFGLECVPVLYKGRIVSTDELKELLNKESALGGTRVEGVVVKNYKKQFFKGGHFFPIMAGKFVSESFKEVHRERWGKEHKAKSRLQTFFESFRTDARWRKAVQRLSENGSLDGSPGDIYKLLKEINIDIEAEEKDEILTWLWNEHKRQLFGTATKGFAEWYKEQLLEKSFQD